LDAAPAVVLDVELAEVWSHGGVGRAATVTVPLLDVEPATPAFVS
jgi:hypothetical protein